MKLVYRDPEGQLVLECPECRLITSIPPNGVTGLQPAFQTNRLLDMKSSLKKALAQIQETGAVTKATHYCLEHPSEEIKLYCEECIKFICWECVSVKHHCHSYKKLDWYKEQIESSLEPLKKQLAATDQSLQQIDTTCKEITLQESTTVADVDRIAADFHEAIEKHRNVLVKQIHDIAQKKLTILSDQKAQIEGSREQLQQCQDDIEAKLKQSDKIDVEQKDNFTEQINELTADFNPDVLCPDTTTDIKFEPVENPQTFIKCGTLSARELLPDPSQCFVVNEALEQEIRAIGSSVTIVVQAIDYLGNPCHVSQDKAPQLQFSLSSVVSGTPEDEYCTICESQYELTFTPNIKGLHYLHVMISGCHIRGSPFAIGVWSSAESLSCQISSRDLVISPWGITVNSKQDIVVTERDRHCVSVFSPNGRKVLSFGTFGSGEGQFNNPRDIAVDHNDNIAVVDFNNHRIQMFTDKGNFLRQIGPDGKGPLQFKAPTAIAFNTYNKSFYVIDKRERSSVQILSPEFIPCGSLGANLKENFVSKQTPFWRIGCDSLGKVYIATVFKVDIFKAEGTFLMSIGALSYRYPGDIAFDGRNLMYLSSRYYREISIFNTEGGLKLIKKLSIYGMKDTLNFDQCRGVTVDRYGIVYVCDTCNNCIRMY